MDNYMIIRTGVFRFVVEDIRTGNQSDAVKSYIEAEILKVSLLLRNLMHS